VEWTAGLQPFDAPAILRALDAHGVRYVLVGGVAAIAHGYAGATFDADIVPQDEAANLRRLADALRSLEAQLYADPRRSDPGRRAARRRRGHRQRGRAARRSPTDALRSA